ncbi:MAG: YdcF family protein [Alphaproteobacteria bacterium]|nr:YdcF family protein [Alphaproteobacteria bacterium]
MSSLSYSFVIPPTILIVLCLLAALIALARPRGGIALMLAVSLLLNLSALPVVSQELVRMIETEIPTGPAARAPEAIVVLGGDLRLGAEPNQPDSLGPVTLERLAGAARLYRATGLPIAVSGGRVEGSTATLGALMRAELEQNFGVPVRWVEEQSETTFENAALTQRLLRTENVTSFYVVTQAWHMPRALWSFERVGLYPIPWPVAWTRAGLSGIRDFLPSAAALYRSFIALHEILGLVYYRLRY